MKRALATLLALLACSAGEDPGATTVWVETASPAIRNGQLLESVGLEAGAGEVVPILEAPCPLPCEERVSFGTADDDQSEILIYLYRGNVSTTQGSHELGVYEIAGLPSGPGGAEEFGVWFRASEEGISLTVEEMEGASLVLRETSDP